MERKTDSDLVSRLLGHCLENRSEAERMFNTVAAGEELRLEPAGEHVELTPEQRNEFVQRFSAEVEPALWESKRLKH